MRMRPSGKANTARRQQPPALEPQSLLEEVDDDFVYDDPDETFEFEAPSPEEIRALIKR